MKAVLLNRILLVLAFAGLFVAGVLSAGHAMHIEVPCGGSNDCATVANHPASSVAGIPVAYFGLLAYVALAVLAVIRAVKGVTNSLVLAGYAVSAIGTIFSLYLQYQSFFVIKAKCNWCIASAIIMVLSLVLHAFLSQALEKSTEPAPAGSKTDTILLMALPLTLIVALGVTISGMGGGGSDKPVLQDGKPLPPDTRDILTAGGHSMGPPDAPLTIVEFADLQCGACQTKSPAVKAFAEQFPGKIRFVFRHFPLAQRHKWAAPAAAVSEYAAEKGKFWEFIMAVMELKRELASADELYKIAESVGLDVNDVKKRVTDDKDKVYQRLTADLELADRFGMQMTPTFFIFAEGQPPQLADSTNVFEILQSPKYKRILEDK